MGVGERKNGGRRGKCNLTGRVRSLFATLPIFAESPLKFLTSPAHFSSPKLSSYPASILL